MRHAASAWRWRWRRLPACRRHGSRLCHQLRRRQHRRHRSGQQQGGAGDQGYRRRPRHRFLAGRARASMSATRRPATLDVFDRKSGKLIKKVPLSDHPNNISVTKNGDRIVVAYRSRQGRPRYRRRRDLDAEEDDLRQRRPLTQRLCHAGQQIRGRGLHPGEDVLVFDLDKEQLAWAMPMDRGVRCMAIETNPDSSTKRVFMQLSAFNGFSDDRPRRAKGSRPHQAAGRARANSIPAVTATTSRRTASVSRRTTRPYGSPASPTTLCTNTRFRSQAHRQGRSAQREIRPRRAAVCGGQLGDFHAGRKELYVSNSGMRSVSVVDTVAMKVTKVIPVGEVPKRNNTLVIPDDGGHAVTPAPVKRARHGE